MSQEIVLREYENKDKGVKVRMYFDGAKYIVEKVQGNIIEKYQSPVRKEASRMFKWIVKGIEGVKKAPEE